MDSEKERVYCIYLIINRVNLHLYVGQSKNPRNRWTGHKTASKTEPFPLYKAMRKYGLENFLFLIIRDKLTLDEANYYETYYINYFNTLKSASGYNATTGGLNHKRSDEAKKRLSERQMGKKCTDDAKRKLSKAHTGRLVSDETRIKKSNSLRNYFKNQKNFDTEKYKYCYKCDSIKLKNEFHKCSEATDGLQFICKDCGNKHRKKLAFDQRHPELVPADSPPKNPHHKLTDEQRFQIKKLLDESSLTQSEIGDMFGVSCSTVSLIRNKKTKFNKA